MQSPITTAFRAFTMLACLVGITAVATHGSSWSAIVEKFKNIELPSAITDEFASWSSENSESGRLEPAETRPVFKMAEAPSLVPAVSDSVPMISPPDATAGLSSSANDVSGKNTPAQASSDTLFQQAAISPHEPPAAPTAPTAGQIGYQDVQDRLQTLGATYYLLESWGNRQDLYRFQCKVAVNGNANYTHYFEATDADPLQAMLQVLRQVEHWREG